MAVGTTGAPLFVICQAPSTPYSLSLSVSLSLSLCLSFCLSLSLSLSHPLHIAYGKTKFEVLLTVHLAIILVNDQLDAQFIFRICNSKTLHVSSTHVLIIRRINCISTTSGICHSMQGTVWYVCMYYIYIYIYIYIHTHTYTTRRGYQTVFNQSRQYMRYHFPKNYWRCEINKFRIQQARKKDFQWKSNYEFSKNPPLCLPHKIKSFFFCKGGMFLGDRFLV